VDWIGSRLVCEDEKTCDQTDPEYRAKHGCAVREWYENTGIELLDFPPSVRPVFGRIEVGCAWTGHGEDADLSLCPPPAEVGER
jgi:hypothetical protein